MRRSYYEHAWSCLTLSPPSGDQSSKWGLMWNSDWKGQFQLADEFPSLTCKMWVCRKSVRSSTLKHTYTHPDDKLKLINVSLKKCRVSPYVGWQVAGWLSMCFCFICQCITHWAFLTEKDRGGLTAQFSMWKVMSAIESLIENPRISKIASTVIVAYEIQIWLSA